MPQFGDYWTGVGLGASLFVGCIGTDYLISLRSANPWVLLGACVGGAVGAGALYMAEAYDDYRTDLAKWCRENYISCKDSEFYKDACADFIKPETTE